MNIETKKQLAGCNRDQLQELEALLVDKTKEIKENEKTQKNGARA